MVEVVHTISKQLDGLDQVEDDHGLEDIQLVVALGVRNIHRRMVSHHLTANHAKLLALGWVDLAYLKNESKIKSMLDLKREKIPGIMEDPNKQTQTKER